MPEIATSKPISRANRSGSGDRGEFQSHHCASSRAGQESITDQDRDRPTTTFEDLQTSYLLEPVSLGSDHRQQAFVGKDDKPISTSHHGTTTVTPFRP